jgi:uncharacterized protein YjdB
MGTSMRKGFFPYAAATALGLLLLASCERDFQNPFDPGSPDYVGDDWSRDYNGDGIADSVEKYYPSCKLEPRQCAAQAKELSQLAQSAKGFSGRDMILWQGGQGSEPRLEISPPELAAKGITLTSSDSQKVLPRNGLLYGLKKGEAKIQASIPGLSLSTSFTAKVVADGKPVKSLSAADMNLGIGQESEPRLTWTPADAAYKDITLISDNPAVALVKDGKVQGAATGAAKVVAEAQDGGYRATFIVNVGAEQWVPLEGLAAEDMNLVAGDDPALPLISWKPENASNKQYQLDSRNKSVAGVTAGKDRVVAKAPGTAQVVVLTLDGSGKTAQFTVRVSARPVPLKSVSVADMLLMEGSGTFTPKTEWIPADASNRDYSLRSDNPAVAEAAGRQVRPLAPGSAGFTLIAADGGLQAAFRVVVASRDTTVHVDSVAVADMDLAAGTLRNPEVTWYPPNAADRTYTLTSLQPDVAGPDGAAVAAKTPGVATLRLETADRGRSALFLVRVFQPDIAVESVRAEPLNLRAGDPAVTPTLAWTPPNATDKRYTLVSDDPLVAAIEADTLVRPAGPGNAKVTLRSAGGATAEFQVSVAIRPVALEAVALASFSMKAGDPDHDLEPVFTPPDATDKGFAISGISDPAVAAAAGPAKVRAVGPGQAVITVETTGPVKLAAVCTVTVAMPVASLAAADLSMRKGETALPPLAWTPANATDKDYSLVSDNPAVVQVSGGGLHALAGGTATVTAASHDGGKTAAFKVTVSVPVTSLSAADITLAHGTEADPVLTWVPADADNKGFTLVSQNAAVASIAGKRVRGEAPGSALVRVTSDDGGLVATFKVTVPDTAVPVQALGAADLSLKVGNPDATPVLAWTPAEATDKGYSLVSAQPGVASIAGNLVHAVAPGTASVQATSHDGGKTALFTVTVTQDTVRVDSIQAADMDLDSNADKAGRAPDITWYPAGAYDKAYTLASADTGVAAVSGNLVVPVQKGNTTVTITTEDGGKTAVFQVRVRGKPAPGG